MSEVHAKKMLIGTFSNQSPDGDCLVSSLVLIFASANKATRIGMRLTQKNPKCQAYMVRIFARQAKINKTLILDRVSLVVGRNWKHVNMTKIKDNIRQPEKA